MTTEATEGKHTPGPWEYKEEFGREGLILTPEGEAIAAFMPDGVGNEQRMKANAHLIKAAPDLLEALISARQTIRTWQGMGLEGDAEHDLWEAYQASPEMRQINAAVAKARGQQ
jgi:hypothetical protein